MKLSSLDEDTASSDDTEDDDNLVLTYDNQELTVTPTSIIARSTPSSDRSGLTTHRIPRQLREDYHILLQWIESVDDTNYASSSTITGIS
jgi:hypothetical protein